MKPEVVVLPQPAVERTAEELAALLDGFCSARYNPLVARPAREAMRAIAEHDATAEEAEPRPERRGAAAWLAHWLGPADEAPPPRRHQPDALRSWFNEVTADGRRIRFEGKRHPDPVRWCDLIRSVDLGGETVWLMRSGRIVRLPNQPQLARLLAAAAIVANERWQREEAANFAMRRGLSRPEEDLVPERGISPSGEQAERGLGSLEP